VGSGRSPRGASTSGGGGGGALGAAAGAAPALGGGGAGSGSLLSLATFWRRATVEDREEPWAPEFLARLHYFHVSVAAGRLGKGHVRLRVQAPLVLQNALCTPLHFQCAVAPAGYIPGDAEGVGVGSAAAAPRHHSLPVTCGELQPGEVVPLLFAHCQAVQQGPPTTAATATTGDSTSAQRTCCWLPFSLEFFGSCVGVNGGQWAFACLLLLLIVLQLLPFDCRVLMWMVEVCRLACGGVWWCGVFFRVQAVEERASARVQHPSCLHCKHP
jgi:hypothetical protein